MGLDVGGRRWLVTFSPAPTYVDARLRCGDVVPPPPGTPGDRHGRRLPRPAGPAHRPGRAARRGPHVRSPGGPRPSCSARWRSGRGPSRSPDSSPKRRSPSRRPSGGDCPASCTTRPGRHSRALALTLKLLAEDAPEGIPSLRRRLREAESLARGTADRMRLLARDLRPPALDTLGLGASLRGLCHEVHRRTGVPICYTGVSVETLPDPVSICPLPRPAGGADQRGQARPGGPGIEVVLQEDAEVVSLSVTDDGRGCDGIASHPLRGIGLVGMRERLENLGGRLEIASRPGRGTCLVASVPHPEREPVMDAAPRGGGIGMISDRPGPPQPLSRGARGVPLSLPPAAGPLPMQGEAAAVLAGAWSGESPLRILLADDHQVVRQGLAVLLEREGFCVVGAGLGRPGGRPAGPPAPPRRGRPGPSPCRSSTGSRPRTRSSRSSPRSVRCSSRCSPRIPTSSRPSARGSGATSSRRRWPRSSSPPSGR